MRVLLVSTYDLGRQPFGVASPAAWLAGEGVEVSVCDVAVEPLDEAAVRAADLVAIYIPMHTATRLAVDLVPRIRSLNPSTQLCFFGLYASMNQELLHRLGAVAVLGGEFEEGLVALIHRLAEGPAARAEQPEPVISTARQTFVVPDRSGLPPLSKYAQLIVGPDDARLVGATEASRGCRHRCRHCPIVPVYDGRFRIVGADVVLADIEQQVAAGAQHITFGDPDFFNGQRHSLSVVTQLHDRFPSLTYDVTIKVEHLLRYRDLLPTLRDTGCILVTSAVESIDDSILEIFDKGHSRDDFFEVVGVLREVGIALAPTFVAFSPWTTLKGYVELLTVIAELDLIDAIAPIQYAIRLLIPSGSRLLELPEVQSIVGPFDERALLYPWTHADPAVDALHGRLLERVTSALSDREDKPSIFRAVFGLANEALAGSLVEGPAPRAERRAGGVPVPVLSEAWY